jgi:hypothetical protein
LFLDFAWSSKIRLWSQKGKPSLEPANLNTCRTNLMTPRHAASGELSPSAQGRRQDEHVEVHDALEHVDGATPVNNARQRIHNLSIQQEIQSDEVSLAQLALLIVEAGVAGGDGLQRVIEVSAQLCQRQRVPARQ